MGQIVVTHASGGGTITLGTSSPFTVITNCVQKRGLMDEDIVEMTVESTAPVLFAVKDTISVYGLTYKLNTLPDVKKVSDNHFEYNLTWEGLQYDLSKVQYLNEDASGVSFSGDFYLMGNMSRFVDVMILNLTRVFGSGEWAKGSYPATDTRNLAFTNENCLSVLNKLCDEFGYEWYIGTGTGINYINVVATAGRSLSDILKYGKNLGLTSLERKTISDKPVITRLYAFGSDRNLPSDYRNYSSRLMIPSVTKSYVENAAAIATYGLIEGMKIFDQVYPRRTGTITSLGANEKTFVDTGMDFDLNATSGGETLYLIDGVPAKIHMQTGKLAGYEFTIATYTHSTKTFVVNAIKDERGLVTPSPTASEFQLAVGDTYVILDIHLPGSYVTSAESELLTAANAELAKYLTATVQFTCEFDEMYWTANPTTRPLNQVFIPGDTLTIYDANLSVNQSVRIISIERDAFRPWKFVMEMAPALYRKFTYKIARTIYDMKQVKNAISIDEPGIRRINNYINNYSTTTAPSAE